MTAEIENRKKATSSLQEFGTRNLDDESKVFTHNAWDNVTWDEEQQSRALDIISNHSAVEMSPDQRDDHAENAGEYWDVFYGKHEHKFFKDRHWFRLEFPELFECSSTPASQERFNILEVGCGAGNSVFPILEAHEDGKRDIMVYACDFSPNAVNIVKSSPAYDAHRCTAFVYDLTSADIPPELEVNSIDVIVMVFVLSAIQPTLQTGVFERMFRLLRPGGLLLFRDYGRFDMTQLRFKPHRRISDNFYARGDGTQVYFFD
eukprot:Partr_v1_DN26581_c2_g1_i2_m3350 putative Methyltransferase like